MLTTALALLTVACPVESAIADDPPRPSDIPAAAAYIELVPTSRGPKAPGLTRPGARPLPAATRRQLRTQGGADADLLEQLATSSAYGAPSGRLRKTQPARELPADVSPSGAERSANALSAAIRAGGEGGDGRLLGLLVVLGALTVAGVAAAAVRRRRPAAR